MTSITDVTPDWLRTNRWARVYCACALRGTSWAYVISSALLLSTFFPAFIFINVVWQQTSWAVRAPSLEAWIRRRKISRYSEHHSVCPSVRPTVCQHLSMVSIQRKTRNGRNATNTGDGANATTVFILTGINWKCRTCNWQTIYVSFGNTLHYNAVCNSFRNNGKTQVTTAK